MSPERVVTGSKLALIPHCSHWARPEVVRSDIAGRDAVMGRAGHAIAERIVDKRPLDAEAIFAEHGLTESEADTLRRKIPAVRTFIDANRNYSWRSEVPFAYNFSTGEGVELPRGAHHRDYSACPDGYVPMTLDLVGFTRVIVDGHDTPCVFVLDWKWGYGVGVEAPRENGQLCGQALAVAAAFDCPTVLVVVAHVRDDAVELKESLFDAGTLATVHGELARHLETVSESSPQPGPHCTQKFCPAIASCPETTRALEAAQETALVPTGPFRLSTVISSPEHASWTIDAVAAVRKALDEIDDAVRGYADQIGGVPRKKGTWGAVRIQTETPDLSVDGASDMLCNMGLGHAIKETATWKAMGPLESEARERLRVMGALKKGTQTRYEEQQRK